MKFILILLANCFFLLYSILYIIDHPFARASAVGKAKQFFLAGLSAYVIYNILFIYLLKRKKEESGLFYVVFEFLKKGFQTVATFIEPIQKELLIGSVIALVLIVISLLLAGLPGGAVLSMLQKWGCFTNIKGDQIWPAAIILSILLPLCIPFAQLTKQYLLCHGYDGFSGIQLLLGMLWIVLIIPLVAFFSSTSS